jgi:glycosyltransferase involved in cell wall biosynthesis
MRSEAVAIDCQPAESVAGIEPNTRSDEPPHDDVDVVIPMRDGASTILAALGSVLDQTCAPGQIFVIDDGSMDGGGELVRAREYPSVTVIEIPACGVSHARNVGIARCKADFIAFLDCDDLWAADKLERQLAVTRENPQAAVVTCGSMSFDMQHRPIDGTVYTPRLRGHVFEKTLKQGFIRGGLSSNMLVRRSALRVVGGYDESMAFGEDVDLWLRLARHYVFDYCRAPLVFIVENHQSTTRRLSTAALRREILLQPLGCLEKWVGAESTRWLLAFGARLTLAYILRERLSAREMWNLREAIIARAPKLAQRLAKTRVHFIASTILAAVVYLSSAWDSWILRRRRMQSSKRFRS